MKCFSNLKKTVCLILTILLSVLILPGNIYAEDDNSEILDSQAIAGGNNDLSEVSLPATQIVLMTGSLKKVNIGDSFQIRHTLKPKKSDDYVTYKSLHRKVAIVDNNGFVTAVGEGVATIRLKTSKGVKTDVIVEVKEKPGSDIIFQDEVSAIELPDSSAMLRVDNTVLIEPVFYPYGTSSPVTYTSGNTKVAKVNSRGLVTAAGDGSTVIYLETPGGIKAEFSVTVYSDVFRGIDVSKWQEQIDWKRVANTGIDFAMLRSSYGSYNTDAMLDYNAAGCEEYGIPYGFYHYTYATTAAEAKAEARFFLDTIKDYSPEYPVVLDIEESYFQSMSRKKNTDIVVAFMNELENAGYYTSVYSSANFFTKYLDMERLEAYDIWVACWGDTERLNTYYDHHYGMWQYSSTGRINGINGDVDLDYAYKDYAGIIRRNGLNNL